MTLATRRKHDLLILGGVALITSYWIVDLITDSLGMRFSTYRIAFDICFVIAQVALLSFVWASLKKRHELEDSLVAERQHAEDEKARAESILAAMDEGISIQDPNYRILYQNETHKRLVGGNRVGQICYEAYSRRTDVCGGCPVRMTFVDGLTHVQEKLQVGSNPERYIEIITSPLRDRDGRIVAGIEMVRDITHRWEFDREIRQLNEQLRKSAAELTAANQELEAFNYSLSHDLRSPLSQIETALDLLAQNIESGDVANEHNFFFVQAIRKGSARIDQMIQGMLDLSRIGRGSLNRQAVDLGAVAAEVVEHLRRRDPQRHVEVMIAQKLVVDGDPAMLRIVVQNLVENAWKYTARVEQPRIEVGECEDGDRRVFYVRDNGAGFNPAQSKRLFVPFQRLHDGREYPGDGIGLSTVHRIVQRHGGTIWAEGDIGKGAVFFFTLGTA